MSLPFEDAGKCQIRKYQCFVCGRSHNTFDLFKEHIVEKHEEGREYLLCPVCQSPVRDMKSHFSTKHPARKMPSGIQTKVSIWHDFKPSGQKKKTRKPSFRSGEFESKKMGTLIPYRSGLECEFLECLEQDVEVESFYYEDVKIPYCYQGVWKTYIVDLRIKYIDGSTQFVEIKPANQCTLETNKCKWTAADNYAKNIGAEFVVLTEVGLGKLKTKIKKQFLNE